MIRWTYLGPRLALAAGLILGTWLALNPGLRFVLVTVGRNVLSSRVEIGSVRTSLLETRLELRDVAIADPYEPSKNLIQAARLTIDIDGKALVQQKLVVHEGSLCGLRIDTPAEGAENRVSSDWTVKLDQASLLEPTRRWLDRLATLLSDELTQELESLESVRLARELTERWPAEYESLVGRVDAVREKADQLRQLAQSEPDNATAALEAYQQAVEDLNALRQEMATIRSEADRLAVQVLQDKEAIQVARQRDLEHFQERLDLARLEPEALSHYLLGPETADQMLAVVDWIRWAAERMSDHAAEVDTPLRPRGTTVCFSGQRRYPDFLIEALAVDAEIPFGGRPVAVRGRMTNVTNQPRLVGRPSVLCLEASGDVQVRAKATLDHTGDVPHNYVVIDSPNFQLPGRVLGDAQSLAVRVEPGMAHLWMDVELTGNVVRGRLMARQDEVVLVPKVAAAWGGEEMETRLRTIGDQVDRIEVAAGFLAEGDDLSWELKSNLGNRLVNGFEQVVRAEIDARAQALAVAVSQRIDNEMAQVDAIVDARRREIFGRLDADRTEVLQLTQTITRGMPSLHGVLDQATPTYEPRDLRAALENTLRR